MLNYEHFEREHIIEHSATADAALQSNLKRRRCALAHTHSDATTTTTTNLLSLSRDLLQLCFLRTRFTRDAPYTAEELAEVYSRRAYNGGRAPYPPDRTYDESTLTEGHFQSLMVGRLRLVCRAMREHLPLLLVRARFPHMCAGFPPLPSTMEDIGATNGGSKHDICAKAKHAVATYVTTLHRGLAYRMDAGYPYVSFGDMIEAAARAPVAYLRLVAAAHGGWPYRMEARSTTGEVGHTKEAEYRMWNAMECLAGVHRFDAIEYFLVHHVGWWTGGRPFRFGPTTSTFFPKNRGGEEDVDYPIVVPEEYFTANPEIRDPKFMYVGIGTSLCIRDSHEFKQTIFRNICTHATAPEARRILDVLLHAGRAHPDDHDQCYYMILRNHTDMIVSSARLCMLQWVAMLQDTHGYKSPTSVIAIHSQWMRLCRAARLPTVAWYWDTFIAPRAAELLPIPYYGTFDYRGKRTFHMHVRDPAVLEFMRAHCPPSPVPRMATRIERDIIDTSPEGKICEADVYTLELDTSDWAQKDNAAHKMLCCEATR